MRIIDVQGITNYRGVIWNLAWGGGGHVAVIECKANTERSHHFHAHAGHALYVVSGAMRYAEGDGEVGDGTETEVRLIRPGQMVITEPGMVHVTAFDVDTVLVSISEHESREAYSADTFPGLVP